ncbi:phycobiliprotein lyase [Lusitaniella coriacea LEGE 07157]|uniref:Chromophore lyase CpcS/CpeS n=1 Tax=Lusitaniella coriacea LEGE 07157 TaxID=945747 RepID=A0A8J7J6K4_9CYAN|nr:phycobiliprotein lyase [Lusitaniella coriacea]MBE9115645.1 phycobiliprotein lyase [Lusitaniella coriacea LEGE 07157]
MTSSLQGSQLSAQALATEFFKQSEGEWRSQRRYYTLTNEEVQEVVSLLQVGFLPAGSAELVELAKLHHLEEENAFICGAKTSWESSYTGTKRKPAKGSTIFGVRGNLLYRDRGFATSKPVTAQFYFTNSQTMCLRTEYNGSVFEEELKLIGQKYRTRQTIISRAGEEQTIGQYLEKRIA